MRRSTLAGFVTLQLALATLGIAIFAYFTWHRLDYFLLRRDDQIITRELLRIGGRGDYSAARDELNELKTSDTKIVPDIFYVLISDLRDCLRVKSATIGACVSSEYAAKGALGVRLDWQLLAAAAESGEPDKLQRPVTFSIPPYYLSGMRVGRGGALLVGINQSITDQQIAQFLAQITTACGVVLLIAIASAVIFIRRVLSSIHVLGVTLDAVTAGALNRRVPLASMPSEIGKVAEHVNKMLDELEGMFASMRHFTKQVAHELKTPLTRIAARLANAQPNASAKSLQGRIAASRQDLNSTLSLFEGFLQIATFDALPQRSRQILDLAHVIIEVAEFYDASVAEKHQHLKVSTQPVHMVGHHGLLQRLIGDVLDNAIKYSTPGTTIRLACGKDGDRGFLEIADHGRGMPQAERQSFMRLGVRGVHGSETPGAGLGLYVVKLIAEAHAMEIQLDDNHPGLRVRFSFDERGSANPPDNG